ncbi:disease resistance protein RPV1 isoform X4 [Populus trichocarpa]|uniref:disease resistance protein RPV1 isoform X4 n=1 Tax=Populus trichocarpa TaxID=3694 RepID=UPI002278298E|nr:disease resistance protein RPV1 isoform X4 [Populus trichocarpa]
MGFFSFIRRLMLILFGTANDLVFLSFSNEDTGKNFSDHLNSALTIAGFRTFKNDDGVRRGENTGSETRKAIQESKISVIVFSKDYASSTRCLDELVMIMDARRATGHIVLPIFYHLDPSEVRSQEGRCFEAFSTHEKSFQGEKGRVEEWRAALREAADVAGMVLQDRYESKFIESIVKEIADKLNFSLPHAPPSSLPLSSALRPPSYFLGLLREWRDPLSLFIFFDFSLNTIDLTLFSNEVHTVQIPIVFSEKTKKIKRESGAAGKAEVSGDENKRMVPQRTDFV